MGFTLVYCGEHYVLDLLAGVVYALRCTWVSGGNADGDRLAGRPSDEHDAPLHRHLTVGPGRMLDLALTAARCAVVSDTVAVAFCMLRSLLAPLAQVVRWQSVVACRRRRAAERSSRRAA